MTTRRTLVQRLALGMMLCLQLAGCGAAPTAEELQAGDEPPIAEKTAPLPIVATSCLNALNQCNARCARLADRGIDVASCQGDCDAVFYNCICRANPIACFPV